ncbi:MAG: hypothetical protein OEV40_31210 [Acidimicrobiia bacterium]|nr:hypothetical protein [Acidimicrobiia bacterium]
MAAAPVLLAWFSTGGDPDQLMRAAFELHVRHDTFPGDEFMRLAVDALDVAQVSQGDPIAYQTLLADHLPEVEFRGKEYRNLRFAVMSVASLRGGLDSDALDEVGYWNDDSWRYTLWAAIALVRASASKASVSVSDLARQLAERRHLDLDKLGTSD